MTITKSITIDGGSNFSSILVPSDGVGILINVAASAYVTLRNLSIKGQAQGSHTFGIRCLSCLTLRVENCTLSNLGTGVQVDFQPFPSNSLIVITLDRVRVENSGYGVRAANAAVVTNSVMVGNNFGFMATGRRGKLSIVHSVAADNLTAVLSDDQAVVTLSDTAVTGNFEGLQTGGVAGQIVSLGDNAIFDNVISMPPTLTVSKQ